MGLTNPLIFIVTHIGQISSTYHEDGEYIP